MYKRGIITISISLLIFLLASLSATVISSVMRETIEVESRIQASLDNSKARLLMISSANIWTKFLTDNGAFWDEIQYSNVGSILKDSGPVTGFSLDDYIKINLNDSERTIQYSLTSTTTVYESVERFITVSMDVFKNGQKTAFGGSFDFGWPGF
ncbi:MAG: hypothetical protein ACP5PP_08440 [Fervidobacterium sp.]